MSLLRTLRDSSSNINAYDKETLDNLSSAFSEVLSALQQRLAIASMSPTSVAKNVCAKLKSDEPGKPAFNIPAELLEDLLGLGFTYTRTWSNKWASVYDRLFEIPGTNILCH